MAGMVAQALKTGARCVSPYEHPWVGLLYSDVQVGAWIATPKLRLAKVEYYRCHSVLVFKEFELLSPYLNNYPIFEYRSFGITFVPPWLCVHVFTLIAVCLWKEIAMCLNGLSRCYVVTPPE